MSWLLPSKRSKTSASKIAHIGCSTSLAGSSGHILSRRAFSRFLYWIAIVTLAGPVLGPPGICNWIGTALPFGAADGIVKNTR